MAGWRPVLTVCGQAWGGASVFTGDFAECHKFTDPVRKGTSSAQSGHS